MNDLPGVDWNGKRALRLRRSVLYVPASNLRAIDKARSLPCDAVVFDLEDAVAPAMKETARATAFSIMQAGGFGPRELIVRVNGLDTEWGADDLALLSTSNAHAVLVPKIRAREDLLAYDQALEGAHNSLQLWAMIETALSLFRLEDIASTAHKSRLSCFVLGTNDLAKELHMQLDHERVPLAPFLSLTVAAARAHGVAVLDGVYNDFNDTDGFESQCRQGLAYGFDGKTLIHPRQIETCNAVFSPSPADILWARQIQAEFTLPENLNKGAVNVAGNMVERLHLAQAEQLLALDAAIRSNQTL